MMLAHNLLENILGGMNRINCSKIKKGVEKMVVYKGPNGGWPRWDRNLS